MPALKPPIIPLKYVVGIDIAKDSFVACLGYLEVSQQLHFGKEVTFDNTASGFADLLRWVAKHQTSASPRWFVVEATGVYYEEPAYLLADNQQLLSILLPNKVKYFAHSTELKSKTDQLKTRAHAYAHSYQPDSRILARLAAQQQLVTHQLKALDQDLADLLTAEPELARKLAHLTSIPGIGLMTAIVVVAETNGFVLVENERQLISYAGLDVMQRQSGLSALATRISRRGNVRPRTALYLPAVSSLRYNPQQMVFYARLRAQQPSGKPGVIAMMRKLLVLCYSLWKNDCAYDPYYHPAHVAEKEVAPTT